MNTRMNDRSEGFPWYLESKQLFPFARDGVLHTQVGLVAPSSVSPESKDGEVFVEGDPRKYVLLLCRVGTQ
jgi:hypothetical protein